MVHVHAKTALTEWSVPGFGGGRVGGRSGRVHPDGAQAGKGAAGVPGQLGDDGGTRAPRCSPPDRRRHGGPAFGTSFPGRGTTIIRNGGLHLTGAPQVSCAPGVGGKQALTVRDQRERLPSRRENS